MIQSDHSLNFFLEAGAPKVLFLYPLLDVGNVYLVPGKKIKSYREEKKIEKTDKNDVELIKEYYLKYPSEFIKLEKEQLELAIIFSKYNYLTKELVRLKNSESAFGKEFGEKNILFENIIKELEKEKNKIIKSSLKSLIQHCKKIGIKGLGPVLLGQYLAFADPRRFHSLSAWRNYLGLSASKRYKDPSKGFYKKNLVKNPFGGLNYQFGMSLLKSKDPLYYKLKEDMLKRFPENKKRGYKMMIYMKVMNRLVSIRLKGVYEYFKSLESMETFQSIIPIKSNDLEYLKNLRRGGSENINSLGKNDRVLESNYLMKSKISLNSKTLDDFTTKFI